MVHFEDIVTTEH